MYRKRVFYDDAETEKNMFSTRTGLQAKYLSKTIREKEHLRAQWNKQRRTVMTALVATKFRDRTLRKRLLNTHPSPLKESVRSSEGFWSMLTYTGQPGQNVLDQILMNCHEFNRKKPGERNVHNNNAQTIGMCRDSATRTNAHSW